MSSGSGGLYIEGVTNGSNTRIPLTRKEKLKEELKVLEWHKMANNAAIKAAIIKTKSTKQESIPQKPKHLQEDAKWIKNVIHQEHVKPLEVSKDFVIEYERREKENADRLTAQVERHISTLKNLRVKLEARHDLKNRSEEYRHWQKEFLPKKRAVMLGKSLDEIEPNHGGTHSSNDGDDEDEFIRKRLDQHNDNKNNLSRGGQSQELSTVLDSLNRLAELEQRITSLEKDNKYDQMKALEQPTASQRAAVSFEFKKKRSAMNEGPVAIKFEVKPINNKKQWEVQIPAKSGVSAVRAKLRQQQIQSEEYEYDADFEGNPRGAGTFITENNDDASIAAEKREALRRERLRQKELAPAGEKSMRSRLQAKKGRIKEQQIAAKKHEEAMRELARRKKEAGRSAAVPITRKAAPPVKGISAGVRSKNKHLQEFEKMKMGHKKRNDDMQRKVISQNNNAYESRFISQTAPAYSNNNHPYHKISTKKEGTVTRRTNEKNAPVRRRNNNNEYIAQPPLTAPPIAVTGIGGLRVIKRNGR